MGGEGLVMDVSLLHSLYLHTPCHVQDPVLAEQVLSDNLHDVDLAIVELLQLMDLDQGKFCVLASLISLHHLSLYTGSAFYLAACSLHMVCWYVPHTTNFVQEKVSSSWWYQGTTCLPLG